MLKCETHFHKSKSFPYTTENGKCGFLVDPAKPEQIANAIRTLFLDEKLRRELGKKGREIAERRFHPDIAAKKYVEFFREIAHSN